MYTTFILFGIILFPIPALIRCIRRGLNPYAGVMDGLVSIGVGTLAIFIYASLSGTSVAAEIQRAINAYIPLLTENMPGQEEVIKQSFDLASSMFPSSVLLMGLLVTYLEYLLLSKIIKNGDRGAWQMARFREFTWPRNSVYGWLVVFLLSWLVELTGIHGGDIVMLNVQNLFEAAFALQGTSFLLMLFHMKRVPRGLSAVVAILAWIVPFGKSFLFLMGIADIILGLRYRIGPK